MGRDFARNGKKHVTKSLVICPNKKSRPEIKRQEMKNLTNNFFWGLMLSLYLWRAETFVRTHDICNCQDCICSTISTMELCIVLKN